MRKIELFLIFGIISLSYIKSQDYHTFLSDRIAYFENQSKYIECVKIDSVRFQKDSIFYLFSNIQEIFEYCFSPFGPSWIGCKIIIQNTGYNFFFNKENDTIKIKTSASKNENWIAYEIKDSIFVVASIVKHDTLGFLGLIDSVKTIGFQVYDKNSQLISHPLNNKYLLLSKNFGLVKTLNFYLFPDYKINIPEYELQEYSLAGLSMPQIGIQNLTWFDVFDFQEGDETHILYEENISGSSNDYKLTQKSIIKYLSRTDYSDSIVYEVEIKRSKNIIWPDTSSYEYLHDIRKSKITPNFIFDKLPGEPIISEAGAYSYYMTNGIELSKTEPSEYEKICISYDTCWTMCDVWGCWPSYTYFKGLGGPYYECDDFFFGFIKIRNKLVYYKKGDRASGTPLIVTNVEEVSQDENIKVFPNPVKDILSLNIPDHVLPVTFELIDNEGQVLFRKEINSGISLINIESYDQGIYLYRILYKSGIIKGGKLLIE